jgi:hypothetical protein
MLLFDELAFSLYRTFYEISDMSSKYAKPTLLIVLILMMSLAAITYSFQKANAFITRPIARAKEAPIATSGDNVYIAWWNNKTGNDEVMFKASTDGGKTFSDKMNLSNSTNAESQDVQIAASGNNVYISWWERNQTSDEPVMRVSDDNGNSFGERIMLSTK